MAITFATSDFEYSPHLEEYFQYASKLDGPIMSIEGNHMNSFVLVNTFGLKGTFTLKEYFLRNWHTDRRASYMRFVCVPKYSDPTFHDQTIVIGGMVTKYHQPFNPSTREGEINHTVNVFTVIINTDHGDMDGLEQFEIDILRSAQENNICVEILNEATDGHFDIRFANGCVLDAISWYHLKGLNQDGSFDFNWKEYWKNK